MLFDLFLQTFAVAAHTDTGARGDETHGAPATYACRYQPSTKLLRSADGAQAVSEAVIFTAHDVTTDDLVWPPGATPGEVATSRKPLRVDRFYDLESGALSYVAVHI